MGYLTQAEMKSLGFRSIGTEVKVSSKASVYNPEMIDIGDYSRIDDYCVLSGRIEIGRNVHIAPQCLVAGGEKGVFFGDFSGLAYQVQVFSQSDDYSGASMTNPTVPDIYKKETKKAVFLGRHVIVGSGSVIMPGVELAEGTSIGALAFVNKSTQPWSIYVGNPARKVADRKRDLLELERRYLQEHG